MQNFFWKQNCYKLLYGLHNLHTPHTVGNSGIGKMKMYTLHSIWIFVDNDGRIVHNLQLTWLEGHLILMVVLIEAFELWRPFFAFSFVSTAILRSVVCQLCMLFSTVTFTRNAKDKVRFRDEYNKLSQLFKQIPSYSTKAAMIIISIRSLNISNRIVATRYLSSGTKCYVHRWVRG